MTSTELKDAVRKLWPKWTGTDEAISNILAALGHPNPSDLQWALKRHHANNLDSQYPKWSEVKTELRPNANRSNQPRDGVLPEFAALLARNREAAPRRLANANDHAVWLAYLDAHTEPMRRAMRRTEATADLLNHLQRMIRYRETRERWHWRQAHLAAGIQPPDFLAETDPEPTPLDEIPF